MKPLAILLLLAVSGPGLGCSRVPERYARASGRFFFEDGEPARGLVGVVRFDSATDYGRGSSVSRLSDDGRFDIMTHRRGDGLPLGEYRVVLILQKDERGNSPVHDDFLHYETTPLRATITAAGPNYFEFKVKRAR